MQQFFLGIRWVLFVQNNNPMVHGKRDNKRIWSPYNESLVGRMKDILDLKDIDDYKHDLRYQNRKKNGRPLLFRNQLHQVPHEVHIAVLP